MVLSFPGPFFGLPLSSSSTFYLWFFVHFINGDSRFRAGLVIVRRLIFGWSRLIAGATSDSNSKSKLRNRYASYFNTSRMSMLPYIWAALLVFYGPSVRDTANAKFQKRCRYSVGRGVFNLQVVCWEMDLQLVWFCAKDDYWKRLATSLEDVCYYQKQQRVVSSDNFALLKNLCRVYFILNQIYWAHVL